MSDQNTELAPLEEEPVFDITETSKSRRLLPPSIYKKHCAPFSLTEVTAANGEKIEIFLEKLRETGNWEESAEAAGLYAHILKKIAKMDERFAAICQRHMEHFIESLEKECHRRAVEGWDEPVYSHKTGMQVGVVRRHDGRLLELMLKRHRKEYKENHEPIVHTQQSVMVVPIVAQNQDDMMRMAEAAAAAARAGLEAPPADQPKLIEQQP